MDFHIFGDKIYATGEVEADDGDRLADIYRRATASGRHITTVMFRNSPGGVATSGIAMAGFIRDNGLNTIFQGGCYSACATAFTGGVERGVAQFDLPTIPLYDKTTIGYHGGSINGVPADPEIQQILYDFDLSLLGPDANPEFLERLHTAHFELRNSNGFLRYLDPDSNTTAAIFCPTGDWIAGDESACTKFEGVNYYSDGVVTKPGYQSIEDILSVHSAVSGDLNQTYGNDLADVYGVLRIGKGGTWDLATQSLADITWLDGGRLNLKASGFLNRFGQVVVGDGGTLSLDGGNLVADRGAFTVLTGGTFSGTGSFHGNATIYGTFAPDAIEMRPYALPDRVDQFFLPNMTLAPGSTTAISIDPSRRTPAFSIVDAEVRFQLNLGLVLLDVRYNTHGLILIQPGANLALNFSRGFYRPGQSIPLIAGTVDPTVITAPDYCTKPGYNCIGYGTARLTPATAASMSGHFSSFIRLNDGAVIPLGQNGDGDILPVGEDSLLGFKLTYDAAPDIDLGDGTFLRDNAYGLYLVAQRAFDDTAIFASPRAGDGLGVALRTASDKTSPGIEPLLGALQFATRKAAREQSGVLRGDNFATLQLADRNMIGMLDAAQRERWSSAGSGALGRLSLDNTAPGSAASDMAMMASYAEAGTGGIAATSVPGNRRSGAAGWSAWGRMLGATGRVDSRQGAEGLDHDMAGVMLGVERNLGDGDNFVGASLAYVTNDIRSPSRRFRSNSNVVSGSLYGGASFGPSTVELAVRYSGIKHDTERTVRDIAGLEAPGRAHFDNDAFSLHAGHAYRLPVKGEAQVRLLAPVIDYVGLNGYSIGERAVPVALDAEIQKYHSVRIGGGADLRQTWTAADSRSTTSAHARLLYQREVGDEAVTGVANFAGEPELPFDIRSQAAGKDILSVDLGVTMKRSSGIGLSVAYSGELSEGGMRHAAFLGVGYSF